MPFTGGSLAAEAGVDALASAELFDPTAGTFTATGSISLGSANIDWSSIGGGMGNGWDVSLAQIIKDGNTVYLTGILLVPEPATLAIVAFGSLCMVLRRKS
jgi:hypothetical protein